jgi:hypothetical protein
MKKREREEKPFNFVHDYVQGWKWEKMSVDAAYLIPEHSFNEAIFIIFIIFIPNYDTCRNKFPICIVVISFIVFVDHSLGLFH